jgi:hypothetical protein
MASLAAEVGRFQDWASRHPRNFREWETDYPDWPDLYSAARQTLAGPMPEEREVELVLYALARDNECECILEMLQEQPHSGMRVARAAVNFGDADARWQVAIFLGTQEGEEARRLLRSLVQDSAEYVRRRALLASVERDPVFAEETATAWLAAEDEYSRLAALSVLEATHSHRLVNALDQLRSDPSAHVRTRVGEMDRGSVRSR